MNAPAKINLTLFITGKLPNSYHSIETVMQQVSLFDIVSVEKDIYSSDIKIICSNPDIPTDKNNLCNKAAEIFFEYTGIKHGLIITIDKQIPIQAGLAGGSSDAAACIKALNILFDTKLSISDMLKIGISVGSDVPFCINGKTCLASGTGTELTEINPIPHCYIVIVKPPFGSNTAEAYKKYDNIQLNRNINNNKMLDYIASHDLNGIASSLYNDFEEILNSPEIFEIKNIFIDNSALGSLMSGSGTCVYGIFRDLQSALNCQNILNKTYNLNYLCHPYA
jgi:4-diphosphocytidyl-2-C-methyl-D-erythritol kinase